MKLLKRIAIGLVLMILLIVGALIAIPIFFKDEIVANLRTSVNKMVDAEVDFTDVDVSFLRSFPDISVAVHDVSVVGIDTFAGLPLMTAREVDASIGFWSVVGGDGTYNIDEVTLDEPRVSIKVITPELANYLITKEEAIAGTGSDSTAAEVLINLDHYEIRNGAFVYDDLTTGTYLKMTGLNTTGDGDFTASVFDLGTYSEIDALTLSQGGVTYLNGVKAVADAVVNVDVGRQVYTFKENAVKLNALDLNFDGSIALEENDDILFDLTYSAPANDFRQLWSMIPTAYTAGFDDVRTAGTFTLAGSVKGSYNGEREAYPAFTVRTRIGNGSVQYPGRAVGLKDIDADVAVNSPSSNLDQLKIDIPRLAFNLGGDPFTGSFRLATPLSDPDVDATLKGVIDLDKWAQAIPLEGVSELGGRIVADVLLQNVRQSTIDRGDYANVNMAGDLRLENIVYVADGLPAVKIPAASADFTPQAINVPAFQAQLGRSDLTGSASITTPLAYFNSEQTMRGELTFVSNYFDADEWVSEGAATTSPAELDAAAATTRRYGGLRPLRFRRRRNHKGAGLRNLPTQEPTRRRSPATERIGRHHGGSYRRLEQLHGERYRAQPLRVHLRQRRTGRGAGRQKPFRGCSGLHVRRGEHRSYDHH